MSSVDRAIFMRLAHVRAAVLSLLAGGFLTLGVLAGWPGAARAGTVKATTASPSASTSASARTTASTKSTASTSSTASAEHRHHVRGAADGEHAHATSVDLQPDDVTVTVAFRLVHVGFRLSDRPGVGQHVEQERCHPRHRARARTRARPRVRHRHRRHRRRPRARRPGQVRRLRRLRARRPRQVRRLRSRRRRARRRPPSPPPSTRSSRRARTAAPAAVRARARPARRTSPNSA